MTTHVRFPYVTGNVNEPHNGPYKEGDTFVAYGHLCDGVKDTNHDKRVTIYHRAEVGYTYKERA